MAQSPLRLIQHCVEYLPQERLFELLPALRGMYVLYQRRRGRKGAPVRYEVVYVGMAAQGSIRARLKLHRRRKGGLWSHFSAFVVWDNIRDDEIRELEGLFRHIYKRDERANSLNVARGFKALRNVRGTAVLGRVVRRRRTSAA